jgi:3-methyladenine DNA glycosylase Tag
MGILEVIKRKFETTFHKANLSDACTALNPEKVKDLLEHAQQVTNRAKTATIFANSIDALGDAGEKLGVAVEKIDASLETGVKVRGCQCSVRNQ